MGSVEINAMEILKVLQKNTIENILWLAADRSREERMEEWIMIL